MSRSRAAGVDLLGQVLDGEVAVGEQQHARAQAAEQPWRVADLADGERAEDRVDDGAGTTGHDRDQA
jgi:hypothetical protein